MSGLEMRAEIEKQSYVTGENFCITLLWDHPEISVNDLGNMSTDIFKVEVERNSLALGFGKQPIIQDGKAMLEIVLPSTLKAGLHVVAGTNLTEIKGQDLATPIRIRFEPIFFEIRAHYLQASSSDKLAELHREISEAREKYINKVHQTDAASGDLSSDKFFRVTVFGVGCLIHARQQLEGFRIDPIGVGLSHKRFLELVNVFLEREKYEGLPYTEEAETRFQQSTPTIAVTYPRVQAHGHEDALGYCRAHSRRVFQLLGMERGQIPREFACIAFEPETKKRWHGFEMPGYRGNLVSDFNPTQLAKTIGEKLPKLEASPFTQLLVRSFAEATGERDFGFQVLRYWTVLELAADRTVPKAQRIHNPNGSPILKPNGKPETTNAKHGRVYQYVLESGSFASMLTTSDGDERITVIIGDASDKRFKPGMVVVTLWEMIQAIYAIRCAVAHEGYFDISKCSSPGEVLASAFLTQGYPDLIGFVSTQARNAIWRNG